MLRILIADDHPVVRAGLRQILAEDPEIEVAAEAGSGQELLSLLRTTQADVLVVDISMPGLPFEELLRLLRRDYPGVPVLILSIHPEDQYGVQALRSGASGYLTKSQSPDHLIRAIRTVAEGHRYVTPAVADMLVQALEGGEPAEEESLTAREAEVLLLLGGGLSTKQAAAKLGVSPKTVSTHRAAILRKLGLRGTADLVRYCLRKGLVT